MRLRRLELQGFKSFMDRTILSFDSGITGVVGPNGCGKSNIVDAIQWVMGEQSAKHLRGESMTDVIFNGSENRAATSMAEVTLVLDRYGVPLAPAFSTFDQGDEISVTRRVYRDGTGEYFINKSHCRLKDIHELFMDTGVGRRAYSIIEQGQVDRMINVKPDERRFLFEEVAGITKYKFKRKEAEKKLEATRGNLVRIHDIVGELEKQIRSLKIQATRARKYRELKTELERVDLYVIGRNLFRQNETIERLKTEKTRLVDERAASDATCADRDALITELEMKRLDQEKLYQSLSEKETQLSLAIQRLEADFALLNERKKYSVESLETAKREYAEKKNQQSDLHYQADQLRAELGSHHRRLKECETELTSCESELQKAQAALKQCEQEKETLNLERNQILEKQHTTLAKKENLEIREKEFLQVRASLNQRLTELVIAMDGLKSAQQEADAKIERCTQRFNDLTTQVNVADTQCKALSNELSGLDEELFRVRDSFHSNRSKLDSLKELQQNLEGYSPTAREILLKLNEENIHAVPLAEVLEPTAEVEAALETLLGDDMNTLLVQTPDEAKRLVEIVQERDLEKVRILALSDLKDVKAFPPPDSKAVSLLAYIKIKEGFERAAHFYLGPMFLTSLEDLLHLRNIYPDHEFLTKDGRVIARTDRSWECGKPATRMGIFARRREITSLEIACDQIQSELNRLSTLREECFEKLKTQERLHEELKGRLSALHSENVEYRHEKEKLQLEWNRTDRDYNFTLEESNKNHTQLDSVREQLERSVTELTTLQSALSENDEKLKSDADKLTELQKTIEEVSGFFNQIQIESSRLQEKCHALQGRIEKIEIDLEDIERRLKILMAQQEKEETELKQIDSRQKQILNDQMASEENRQKITEAISEHRSAFQDTSIRLQEIKEERAGLQKRREELLNCLQEAEVKLTQETLTLENVQNLALERYGRQANPISDDTEIDISQLPVLTSQLEVHWAGLAQEDRLLLLEEHLKSLREKVGRYGEVNLTAIQEFDEIQKRYDFLTEQKTDLEKSIELLEQAIQKIDSSTKQRFTETFDAVNAKFKEIFPILFNGGKAELSLTEGENVLEAGIDILVHPPGKKPSSISLLSGGEKALTAVSLILAIFARKPSPFCLLDEVDAPLDDANVSRFNTVIKKMAEKTQFIVITHNKKTMEVAESLYGVTMERPGVSKMASVRLN